MPADTVLDSSAIMTVLQGETGMNVVLDLIGRARRKRLNLHTSFLCLTEVEYLMIRRTGDFSAQGAMAAIANWPMNISESNPDWSHEAAVIKARGGLSLADAWIAALAVRLDAELVHKDKEFDRVPGLKAVRL